MDPKEMGIFPRNLMLGEKKKGLQPERKLVFLKDFKQFQQLTKHLTG